jgi:hypothetical protein
MAKLQNANQQFLTARRKPASGCPGLAARVIQKKNVSSSKNAKNVKQIESSHYMLDRVLSKHRTMRRPQCAQIINHQNFSRNHEGASRVILNKWWN